jgi:UDP-N-acetylglucosamine enolpyruvyl transferase
VQNSVIIKKTILWSRGSKGLVGADMLLDEASVTGTANIVMAAVLAKEKQLFIMLPVSLICSSCVKC